MATAQLYNEWEDEGLSFDPSVVAEYDPQKVAVGLREGVRIKWQMASRMELIEKQVWIPKFLKDMRALHGWIGYALELDPEVFGLPSDLSLPSVGSDGWKELSSLAITLEPREWLETLTAQSQVDLRHYVTLGRRKRGTKTYRSHCNKLANCIVREYTALNQAHTRISAFDRKMRVTDTSDSIEDSD